MTELTPLDDTYAAIPGYPNYLVLKDRSKGIKVKSLRRPRPNSRQQMGGQQLTPTLGRYRLTNGPRILTKSFTPEELWEATYLDRPLPDRSTYL